MPQSLSRILIHTVFSTKNRQPFFSDPDVRSEMHAVIGGMVKKLGCQPIRIGGMPDHVHLLTTLSRTLSVADFVKETKRASTDWIRQRDEQLSGFHWQAGYGVFSVSESNAAAVEEYILNQYEHHRATTFQDEFRAFCQRHRVDLDERYAWD